ncbi:Neopullulanase [Candidatus Hydrogenisulfobacillus filiaventi]|uniref:Neopullulanase n=1 Tax=Candidatus Hydrogenisulfobacillus filiaventi TaxID=2707344 RepID=A0A6F8ZH51_9FIRM|nr:Neopullulanase [Candidatus Hydrogenisulfobacillus filiaventi]
MRFAHRSQVPDAYALSGETVRLRLRTGRGEARRVRVHFGDPYRGWDWRAAALDRAGQDLEWDYWEGRVPVPTRRLRYCFEAEAADGGRTWLGEEGTAGDRAAAVPFRLPYLHAEDRLQVPAWTAGAVGYAILCDRFARTRPGHSPPGADPWDTAPGPATRLGGSLAGIRRRLPYLQALGVNLLYLTPIFRAASPHGYDPCDYFDLDPACGTKADLTELVEAAHGRGMRVLLDAVFQHSGSGFRPFREAARAGPASPYWPWFVIHGERVQTDPPNYETFGDGVASMPRLNLAHPAAADYFLEVAVYWIRETGVDGWRLDVGDEVAHAFWRRLRERVKAERPDALLVGEAWHDALPWLAGGEWDGVMHYRWREAVKAALLEARLDPEELGGRLLRLWFAYPEPAARASFLLLGSHDTERVLTAAAGDVTAVERALVVQFTWPGIPVVYYGDEAGMTGGPDPGCRAGMWWDPRRRRHALVRLVRALACLRRTAPALIGGGLRVLPARGLLLYDRLPEGEGPALRVAVQTGPASRRVPLPPGARRRLAVPEAPAEEDVLPAGGAAVWEWIPGGGRGT